MTVWDAGQALSASTGGFNARELAEKTVKFMKTTGYTGRQAAYDMNKLRGKAVVVPVKKTRRCRLSTYGVRVLAGLLILREKVIKPLLSGISKKTTGRQPKNIRPVDLKYESIRKEMLSLLIELHLVAT